MPPRSRLLPNWEPVSVPEELTEPWTTPEEGNGTEGGEASVSNFEKITETPETLDAFLESLTVINSPWEDEFHKAFCGTCGKTDCGICPHQDKRKETRAPCVCCDNTGKVTIKGVEYPCPRCKGNWREKEVVGETTIYSVAKWVLERIDINQYGMSLTFKQTNSTERFGGGLRVRQADFRDMVSMENISKRVKLYDDYKAAMAEVKRLNAAEREKLEGAGGNG